MTLKLSSSINKWNSSAIIITCFLSSNFNLNNFVTQECTCDDKIMSRNITLMTMFKNAIEQIMKNCPHCPDYILIYRQGGSEYRNKILTITELENFTNALKELREKMSLSGKTFYKAHCTPERAYETMLAQMKSI